MKRDALTTFSDSQAVTAAAASDNILNLGVASRQLGVGTELYVVTVVEVTFTDSSSNSALARIVETDDASGFSSATTVQTLKTIPALAVAGDIFVDRLSSFITPEQFLRLTYTPSNGNLTTGTVTSFLSPSPQQWTKYAKGYTVSSSGQF